MNFETQLITLACDAPLDDQKKIEAAHLPLHYFVLHQDEWSFMCRYFVNHGRYPTREALTSEFPKFHTEEPKDPVEYYIKKLNDRFNYSVLNTGIEKAAKLMSTPGYDAIEEAVSIVKGMTEKFVHKGVNKDTDISETLWAAHTLYKQNPEDSGNIFPVPYQGMIDKKITPYFMGSELITIFGNTGMGKTWYLLWMAICDWWNGHDVLFLTPEMTSSALQMRRDALLYGLNYTNMEFKTMSPQEEKHWIESIQEMEKHNTARFIVCGLEDFNSATTKSWDFIRAKMEEHKCPCVNLDSAHLLYGTNGLNFVEEAYTLSRQGKQLAKSFGVKFTLTTQAGKDSEGKEGGGGLKAIQWGYAFAQDSDFVGELYGPGGRKGTIRYLNWLKTRRGQEGELQLNYQFEPMDLTEIDGIEGEDEGEFDPEGDDE